MKLEKFRLKRVLFFWLSIVAAVKVLFQGYGPDREAKRQNSLTVIIQEHKPEDLIWPKNLLMHNERSLSHKITIAVEGLYGTALFCTKS